ncbi:hypothetical protein [Streptomyces sp. NPDC053079]|uniref:hypothetical protein n=1 Tax=Streptomyces sp. NPDC053079 TaxID=3365697 RepID=UPI0037D2142D
MPEPADADPAPAAAPRGQVHTRENACDGYRRALAAHQAAGPQRRVDPAIAEAVERQTAAMRELSRRAFPESKAAADDAPARIEQAHAQRHRQAAATESVGCVGPVPREPVQGGGTFGPAHSHLTLCAILKLRSVNILVPPAGRQRGPRRHYR